MVLAGLDAGPLGRRPGARRRRRRPGSAPRSPPSATTDDVDAWYRHAGYLEVSTAPAHDGAGRAALEACRELGVPDRLRAVSAAEVQEHCHSPEFRAGVIEPGAATVQPARLALGHPAPPARGGVEIYESSPVRRFREAADGVEATTATGARVRAGRGVLAIGGAAKGHGGPLRGRLTVASSHIVITEPVPDVLEKIGWTGGEAITDGRALVHYFRTTPDGRIAFGWGGGRIAMGARIHGRTEVDPDVVEAHPRHLLDYFPDLIGRRVTHAWGGPIDASPTHLPAVTSLPASRAWVAAGYTGNGVGPTNMVGRTLASLALDRGDDPTRLAFVDADMPRVPPEPFHWIGGEAIRLGIDRKEEAEMEGRRPGRIAVSGRQGPRADRLPHRPARRGAVSGWPTGHPQAAPQFVRTGARSGLPAPLGAQATRAARVRSSCSGRTAAIFSARRCCQVVKPIAATVMPKRIIAMQLTSTGTPRWKAPKM